MRDSIPDLHLTWILVAVSSLCLCPMALATKMRECFVPRLPRVHWTLESYWTISPGLLIGQ